MSTIVTAYPVSAKRKSFDICVAFITGCGGQVAGNRLREGTAFFYGVDASNLEVWRSVISDPARQYLYSDNSFFDKSRQQYFRVSKNALQHSGLGTSDGKRLDQLGIEIKPWRTGGDYILLCPQSEHFMRTVVGEQGSWTTRAIAALGEFTDRPIKVRQWSANKSVQGVSLLQDLDRAYAVITWSSAAAVTAVLHGVPVVTMGQSAAEPMSGSLRQIESLPRPENRREWASVLADQQWTLQEFKDGTAWRSLDG